MEDTTTGSKLNPEDAGAMKADGHSLNKKSSSGESQTWGELVELRSDGSQIIRLFKSSDKPFGFRIARGNVNNRKGRLGGYND